MIATGQAITQNHEMALELEVSVIRPPKWRLRPLNKEVVEELQRSIQNTGLLQPIVVRRSAGQYELVFGSHRLAACKALGLRRVGAIITDFTDDESFLARVTENLVRNDYVDPLEEARGYKILVQKGWTVNAIGHRVGKCDSYVSERIGLLEKLSPDVRAYLSKGSLTPSHAELLSRIRDPAKRDRVAELVVRKRLSVRTLETIINHAPLPCNSKLESISGEYYLKIPEEFINSMKFTINQTVFVYVKGGKLIIDSAQSRCRSKKGSATLKHDATVC